MSQEKKGKVTIANLIALAGLAGLGFATFLGMFFHSSGGNPAVPALGSVAFVAGLGFLLFMAIKAKGAESDVKSWRFVEWVCLLAYVAVAALFASPFQRCFYVVSEKENLQAKARNEAKAIQKLYNDYEYQTKKHLETAKEQLENYADSRQGQISASDMLYEYAQGISNRDEWYADAQTVLKLPKDLELVELKGRIESWNFMRVASLAADLKARENAAWTSVETKIRICRDKNRLIPVIVGGIGRTYEWGGYAEFELDPKPEPALANALKAAEGNTVLGWVLYAVLNLMVLLNYAVASRSSYVGPKQGNRAGGLPL